MMQKWTKKDKPKKDEEGWRGGHWDGDPWRANFTYNGW
jgi:hypothetical protein